MLTTAEDHLHNGQRDVQAETKPTIQPSHILSAKEHHYFNIKQQKNVIKSTVKLYIKTLSLPKANEAKPWIQNSVRSKQKENITN